MNVFPSKPRLLPALLVVAGACLMAGADRLPAEDSASFTVDTGLGDRTGEGLQLLLECRPRPGSGEAVTQSARLPKDGTVVFEVDIAGGADWSCAITAATPPGLQVRYRGDGGSEVDIAEDGCRFSAVQPGHANFCQIQVRTLTTSLTVYKKWIGASRREPDVSIELMCAGERVPEGRDINAGKPGGWFLSVTDPEGVICHVLEAKREEFVSDAGDCENLLILPGSEEECTLINTKVVKMIDMLNRYGLAIMIIIFMVVGMLAARRFVP